MRRRLDSYINEEYTKTITLTLTNQCNLNCVYCYEHNKNKKVLSFENAKKIIDEEMNKDDGLEMVCIDFFGGEPFLEFDMIVKIFDYLKANKWKKEWFCFTTTNGTKVHGEVQEWILNNSEKFEALLSFDGTLDMQDINRSNSSKQIDLDFFKKTCPYLKMTISNKTLPKLAEGIIWLHEQGFYVSANLGYGVDWNNEENLRIYAEQLNILMKYYLEHPDVSPSTILDMGIPVINPFEEELAIKYCGVGTQMATYNVDGEKYACHMFAPLAIGEELAKKSKELVFSKYVKKEELDEKCRNCPVLNICPTCYGINFATTENIYHKDDAHCRMMKVQFMANAKFQYEKYVRGLYELTKEQEYRLLNNIRITQQLEL